MSRKPQYDEASLPPSVIVLDTWSGIGLRGHSGSMLKLLVGGIPTGVTFCDADQVRAVAVALHDLADEIERPDPDPEPATEKTCDAPASSLSAMRAALKAARASS